MALIDSIREQARVLMTGGMAEDVAMRQVLNEQDYHNPDIRKGLFGYVSSLVNGKLARDLPLTVMEMKEAHFIITKLSLVDLGLENVQINYSPKLPKDAKFAAFYKPGNPPSVNFFDETYLKESLIMAYPNRSPSDGAISRAMNFISEIQLIEHEIQHGVQDVRMREANANPDKANPNAYIMIKQTLARVFTQEQVRENKYFKQGTAIDRLYLDNHDNFYQELDSDKYGYDRAYRIFKTMNQGLFKNVLNYSTLPQLYDQKFESLINYDTVMWNHDTNPNASGVSANYKASLILDTTLARMNPGVRNRCFEDNPVLLLSYNKNGTKKSLEQIESERDAKIQKILTSGTDAQVKIEANNLSRLYDTIIESDPVLSFEWCLRHIVYLGYNDEKYFVTPALREKYSPKDMREEIRLTAEKAKLLCGYMEAIDSKTMHSIIKKYTLQNLKMPKHNPTQQRYFQDRKLVLADIEMTLARNEEVYNQYLADIKSARTKQVAMDKAKTNITKAFPGLQPTPYLSIMNADGQLEMIPNKQQKIILSLSIDKYRTEYFALPEEQREGLVTPLALNYAVSTIYGDVITTREDRLEVEKLIQQGEIGVLAGATMQILDEQIALENDVTTNEPVVLSNDAQVVESVADDAEVTDDTESEGGMN